MREFSIAIISDTIAFSAEGIRDYDKKSFHLRVKILYFENLNHSNHRS